MTRLKRFLTITFVSASLIVTSVNIFISCSPNGDECDRCDSDTECKDDLTCERFTDLLTRCANINTTCKGINWSKEESNSDDKIKPHRTKNEKIWDKN